MSAVTLTQAQAVLNAIKAQHAKGLKPLVIDGEDFGPTYSEPVLIMDFAESGFPGIVWEESAPYDWPFLIGGGTSEEDYALTAEANAEFGSTLTAPVLAPAKIPAGVFVEPINSVSVGIYPA